MQEQNTNGQMQEREMTLKDYIRILYRGRWIIAISFIVIVAATAYLTFTTQPVYEASALVLLKQEGGVQAQIFEVSSFIKRETMMNNQVEILKSRKLAEDVIKRLQNSPYSDSLWILGSNKEEEKFSIKKWIFSFIKRNGVGKEPS